MPSPLGSVRSTRTTSAPRSASSIAHIGTGPIAASSMILMPCRGPNVSLLVAVVDNGNREPPVPDSRSQYPLLPLREGRGIRELRANCKVPLILGPLRAFPLSNYHRSAKAAL